MSIIDQPIIQYELGEAIAPPRDAIFIGCGIHFPMSLKTALRLREISCIQADGYAVDALKHGPIVLIAQDMPVMVFDSLGALHEETRLNIAEVEASGVLPWHAGQDAAKGMRTPATSALAVQPLDIGNRRVMRTERTSGSRLC